MSRLIDLKPAHGTILLDLPEEGEGFPSDPIGQLSCRFEPWPTDAGRQLLQRASFADPVVAVHQTAAYLDHLAEIGRRPVLASVVDAGGRVLAVLPMRETATRFGTRAFRSLWPRPRRLIMIGSGPIGSCDPAVLDCLFEFLARSRQGTPLLEAYAMRPESPFGAFLAGSKTVSSWFGLYALGGLRETYSVVLPESLDAYHARFSKKRRYNLKRQERLLTDHLGGPLRVERVEHESEVGRLEAALSRLSSVPRYEPGECLSQARHGILLCFLISAGSEIVGVVTGIRSEHAYFAHDIIYNKALTQLSPGTTCWQAVLRDLIAKGDCRRVGISHGSPAYRFSETTLAEPAAHLVIYRRTAVNRLRFAAINGIERAERALKRCSAAIPAVAGA